MKSIEEIAELLDKVLLKWLNPDFLKHNYYSSPRNKPAVGYEISKNREKHTIIRIITNTGPFGEFNNTNERVHYNIENMNENELVNHLLNTLTFKGSPFYLSKKNKFEKNMEFYG